MKLSDFMDARAVEPELDGGGSDDVLGHLVDRMTEAGILSPSSDALQRLKERERLKSTGIGGGIAIPHAKTAAVSRTWVALGRSPGGVPFDAEDGKPVNVVFLILGPPDSSAEHVKVLSCIARLVRKPEFMAAVAAAADGPGLMGAVESFQE